MTDKSKIVCVNFTAESVTPWINSACVEIGNTCNTNNDCYGNKMGLVCSNGNTDKNTNTTAGVCVQCVKNGDCATGYACKNNACVNCSENADCGDGNVCLDDKLCCPGGKSYDVNGGKSCTQGKSYDLCVNDSDCLGGKCYSMGSVKVCGFTSNDECLFSAASTSNIVSTTDMKPFICPLPNGPYDSTSKPFCSKGKCSKLSDGSACSIPPYCNSNFNDPNLLCNRSITFNNPYQFTCKGDQDCADGNKCSKGVCSPTCTTTASCDIGYVCNKISTTVSLCQYPPNAVECTNDSVCPNGYTCQFNSSSSSSSSSKKGVCQFNATTQNPKSTPPPYFPSICSVSPYTLSPTESQSLAGGYCVNGYCQQYAGWVNQLCVADDDCSVVKTDTKGRISFVCIPKEFNSFGTVNRCLMK